MTHTVEYCTFIYKKCPDCKKERKFYFEWHDEQTGKNYYVCAICGKRIVQ